MSVKRKKIILAVALIVAVNLLIIALAQSADAALYKRGSSGATVTEIQTRLKSWGYYDYAVDASTAAAPKKPSSTFSGKTALPLTDRRGIRLSPPWASTLDKAHHTATAMSLFLPA